jgi:hypothetical protein
MTEFLRRNFLHGAILVALMLVGASAVSASSTNGGSGTSNHSYLPSAVKVYNVTLSGPAESPPNASPGVGTATVTVDTVAQTMTVDVSFSGLTSNTTASHIHCCTATSGTGTAGVATQTPTFVSFPLGVTSGTYSHTFDMTLAGSYNPAFITANGGTTASAFAALLAGIDAGKAYLNIHTTNVPSGEIRGFLVAAPTAVTSAPAAPAEVPEADTLLLFGGGIGGLGMWLRWQWSKRRKSTRN